MDFNRVSKGSENLKTMLRRTALKDVSKGGSAHVREPGCVHACVFEEP